MTEQPLSVRVCGFLVSNGPATLRNVYEALDERLVVLMTVWEGCGRKDVFL